MKFLIIVSSGRKSGNTSKVASLLLKKIEKLASEDKEQFQVEKLFLTDYNLKHCIGCRNCMDRGEERCPLNDDLSKIKMKLDEADSIIFGSPVYVDNVSSVMKALIDRLAYICHRQEFYEKSAFVYSTSGGSSNKHTNRAIAGALLSWGFNLLGTAGFITDYFDSEAEVVEKYGKKLDQMAKKVYESVKKKSYQNPSVLSLAIFKLQQKHRANPKISHPLDYKYWKEKGWAESGANYYGEHKTKLLKLVISRILYATISFIFVR